MKSLNIFFIDKQYLLVLKNMHLIFMDFVVSNKCQKLTTIYKDHRMLRHFVRIALILVIVVWLWSCGSGGSSGSSSEIGSSTRNQDIRPNIIIVFTDDQGYADIGSQNVLTDIHTPNLDRFAAEGVRMTDGYVTAPQSSPSRAGLLTGRYQQRFGFDSNSNGPLPLDQATIADRLTNEGYVTGMVGKWHLEPNEATQDFNATALPPGVTTPTWEVYLPYLPQKRGFKDVFWGSMNTYLANYSLDGKTYTEEPKYISDRRFRVDVQTEAALQFIERHKDEPFFLYLSYFAPHVPLEAPDEYLARFPEDMPEQRRYALAMISAIDDGVGSLLQKLEAEGLDKNTLFFFISDNGAPLGSLTWDGSVNTPLNGEKGMLLDGGVRVPFLVRWPNNIPGGQVVKEPVMSLDVLPTVLGAADIPMDPSLDGINLLPMLANGSDWPNRPLYWRFWNQAAIRQKTWKYLYLSNGSQYLFDLENDPEEKKNLIGQYPGIALELSEKLKTWSSQLQPAELPGPSPLNLQETLWYDQYLQ